MSECGSRASERGMQLTDSKMSIELWILCVSENELSMLGCWLIVSTHTHRCARPRARPRAHAHARYTHTPHARRTYAAHTHTQTQTQTRTHTRTHTRTRTRTCTRTRTRTPTHPHTRAHTQDCSSHLSERTVGLSASLYARRVTNVTKTDVTKIGPRPPSQKKGEGQERLLP